MDKSWMHKSRLSNEYAKGVESFLDFAFDKSSEDNMIVCPCVKCANVHWHTREVVEEHLMCDGILRGYTCWFFHGELVPSSTSNLDNIITMPPSTTQPTSTFHSSHGAMGELLRDAFNIRHDVHGGIEPNIGDVVNDEAEVRGWGRESKQLWVGVQTYDASRKQNFNLRAALMWTINDFPAYAILSGWSTKGKYACPCCAAETTSRWLSNGQKFCYMGHRRWLAKDHPYRLQKHLFDGTLELREAPLSTSGSDILLMLNDVQYSYGKRIKQRLRKSKASSSSKKRQRQESNFQEDSVMDKEEDESQEADLWKKRSIFFDLPYWEHLLLRHNLDVMHIEKNLKNYVRNKRYPEGSIAEGYLAEECVTFCSRYLEDVETIFDKPSRNLGEVHDEALGGPYLFHSHGQPIGKFEITELDAKSLAQAHRYVLLHHDVTVTLQSEYKNILRQQMRARRSTARDVDMQFTRTFHEWLAEVVSRGRNVTEEVRFLAQGPNRIVKRYKGYIINGFRFHTKSRERLRRTQNSGCVVTSSTVSYASASDANPVQGNVDYYGILNDIIELDYFQKFKVVLFRCDWADVTNSRGIKKDKYGFTMVNFSRLIHTGANVIDEPYVFSSQVKQVFYSKDLTESGWYVVIRNHAREVYDMGDESTESGPRTNCFPTSSEGILSSNDDEQWVREDVNEDVYAA
ncbi:uncharacterized protein LOC120273139 [Dioscorea cayenensis subsp. rotundata]|uniref:Uncharacterized protein LOC120273139 n=1 Tax=Dioscorea cayennensis subsp. rotundata TaxID=55577 RepID=A0AB40C9C6_DIOCR|nr:uncharacterized protein LOC120273139 [Dioscorea cayenensis subsp. rotundata]